MGNRLSKIYTRTGDDGSTGIAGGDRVAKDSARIEAIGTSDELNSQIGVLLTHDMDNDIREMLTDIQHDLFDLGSEFAMPGYTVIGDDHVTYLEQKLDHYNADLPYLKEFILPGGSPAAACCHVARTVCRRCERCIVALMREENINPAAVRYINRLSDLLFVLGRVLARADGGNEVLWQKHRRQQPVKPE